MPQGRIEFVLDKLSVVLQKMVENKSELVKSIDPLGEDEKQWLVSSDYLFKNSPRLLHDRFVKAVQRFPDIIAIDWQNTEAISYSQLGTRTNQMAAFLTEQGVRQGDMVPLLLDKSPTM